MPALEFEAWRQFYRDHPFDDLHRYHRPAALIASHGTRNRQQSIDDALKWLCPDPVADGLADADLKTLAAFGLKPPR